MQVNTIKNRLPVSVLAICLMTSVAEAQNVDCSKHLKFAVVNKFQLMWNDEKSGAKMDGQFYRPIVSKSNEGFHPVGDIAESGYSNPDTRRWVLVVKEITKGALAKPKSYQRIWDDSKSGATLDGSMWQPIPPDGYVAMGTVSQRGREMPSLDAVRCVRSDLVAQTTADKLIWNDKKSGAAKDFSAWSIKLPPPPTAGQGYIDAGTFVGVSSYEKPTIGYVFRTSSAFAKNLFPRSSSID